LRFCSALALPPERWEERLDACRFGQGGADPIGSARGRNGLV